jgi:hypothetical protein
MSRKRTTLTASKNNRPERYGLERRGPETTFTFWDFRLPPPIILDAMVESKLNVYELRERNFYFKYLLFTTLNVKYSDRTKIL